MTDETTNPDHGEPEESGTGERVEQVAVGLKYDGTSRVFDADGVPHVALVTDAGRSAFVSGTLQEPVKVREALSVLYDVVKSDTRYKPRDRMQYLAYQQARNKSAGSNVFQAQREFFEFMQLSESVGLLILDPIVTVHPDEILFEVFSKDESTYARLGVDWSAVDTDQESTFGTTNIDFSADLLDGVQRMRSYRATRLQVGPEAVALDTHGAGSEVVEKKVDVPATWLRGFLQVQSAATLPLTSCAIAPIDLYNVLRHLRLNADQKKGGRAIRVELMPGERPKLVLEPWEVVVDTTGEIYKGRVAQVIRIWGRRRLGLLRRLLPMADSVELHMLGTGLPIFTVLRCGAVTLTLGLTGFTSSNWSQALNLDTLLPRSTELDAHASEVLAALKDRWFASIDDLAAVVDMGRAELRRALQACCQNGQVMFDLAREVYRYRPVVSGELDLDALVFRNPRERLAHDLIAGKGGEVVLESENRLPGVGVQYVGAVTVDADRREYRCEMTIDDEGRTKRVDDTSPFFRKHQLKEGPSAPLIALRLKIAELQRARAASRGQGTIAHETRTYVK
ncbi:MAG: SWIM zinc finger family protein, partial [Myxococcota bacterium]